jgi:hypothetical protein
MCACGRRNDKKLSTKIEINGDKYACEDFMRELKKVVLN